MIVGEIGGVVGWLRGGKGELGERNVKKKIKTQVGLFSMGKYRSCLDSGPLLICRTRSPKVNHGPPQLPA